MNIEVTIKWPPGVLEKAVSSQELQALELAYVSLRARQSVLKECAPVAQSLAAQVGHPGRAKFIAEMMAAIASRKAQEARNG